MNATSRDPKLFKELHAPGDGRPICTLRDALRLIDRDVPKDRRHAPHWRRTRETLARAVRSKDALEIRQATEALERALAREATEPMVGSGVYRRSQ